MDAIQPVEYRIDAQDRLDAFNDGWVAFARANGAPALEPSRITGRVLWDFLSDMTTRHLYGTMVKRVREGGPPVRFHFRCDAPERRRLLSMEIAARAGGGIGFRVESVREQARPAVALLDASRPRAGDLLTICAWCKRVRLPSAGAWAEVEDAVRVLGLFGGAPLPALTHGMCPECQRGVLEAAGDGSNGELPLVFGALPGPLDD